MKNHLNRSVEFEADAAQPWANSLVSKPSNFHQQNISQAMQLSSHF